MKFRIPILCFILIPIIGLGQFDKSSHIVGGSFSFTHSTINNFNASGISLNTGYGFALADRLYLGSEIAFRWSRSNLGPSSTSFTPAPFLKYYLTANSAGGFYGRAQFEFSTDRDPNFVTAQPSVGYSLFAGDKVFFEIDLSYNKVLRENTNDNITLSIGIFGLFGGTTND